MVTFRKSLLLLAIVAMMAAVASAQVGETPPLTCTANAGVPPIVRAEGLAELVGDVVLQCTGGTPAAVPTDPNVPLNVPKVNFRIFMNTTVTSRLLTSGAWNEALLMIDEPAPGNQRICTQSNGCGLAGVGSEPGVDYAAADYNVWQGTRILNNVGEPAGEGTPLNGSACRWILREPRPSASSASPTFARMPRSEVSAAD